MRVSILFICFILFGFNSFAQIKPVQNLVDRTKETTQFETVKLISKSANIQEIEGTEKDLKKGQVVTLDFSVLDKLYQNQADAITFDLPIDQNKTITLELVKVNIFGATFNVKTDTEEFQNYKAGAYYRGVVKDMPNSIAAISFFKKEIIGVISTPKHGNLNFGKIKNKTEHIIYAETDFINPPEFTCGTLKPEGETDDLENNYTHHAERVASKKVVGVYLECEHDFYLERGTVNSSLDFITGLYNVVATLYANEAINTVISQVFVWTNPDSYPTTTSEDVLNYFRNNRPYFQGDLAHLIVRGAPGGGGVAYENSNLCGTYNYAYSGIDNSYSQFPTYSWSVKVVTHEIGHNLGSPHTHDCRWNGNNTAIDGCGPARGFPGQSAPGSSAPCPIAPLPTNGGTIMSYCQGVANVGINFSKGFGPQPGNLIRSKVNSSCIGDAIGEIGQVTRNQLNSTTFYSVNLRHNYNNPVVVMGPISYNGSHPSNVRVKNITSNSFEYQVDEWEYLDGGHITETISYMVVESGTHILPNGVRLVASKNNINQNWATINFPLNFGFSPILFSQISTHNDRQAATTRQRNVTATNFQIRIQEEEASDGSHFVETVSWIAISQSQSLGSFSVGRTGNSVTHSWKTIGFANHYNNPVFLAKPQTYNGPDPMALRYRNLTNSNVQIFCEEEASRDTEVAHTTEDIGYVVFNGQQDLVSTSTFSNRTPNTESVAASTIKKDSSPLTIYPNPVLDILQIDYKGLEQQQSYNIQIIDMIGNIVLISDNLDNIDVSHLDTGMYLLKFNPKNSTAIHQKFIKM